MSKLIASTLLVLERQPDSGAASLGRPLADEHDPYYSRYIDKVPQGDYLTFSRRQVDEVAALFGGLSPSQGDFAYAPGKWTIKEVLGHLIDTERVFAFRAASISRRDPGLLPNFDQDLWGRPGWFGNRSLNHLLAEWIVVRASTLLLVEGLPPDASTLRGTAAGNEVSVRALLYVPPGHVAYHLEILRERYMGGLS